MTSFIVKVGCCFDDELLPAARAAFETDYNEKVFSDAYNEVYSEYMEGSRLGVLRLNELDKVMLFDTKSRLDKQTFFLALERNESTTSPTEELVDSVFKKYEEAKS